MPRLNDTQTILLSTASQRDDRALLPLPDSLRPGARVSKAIAALVSADLAEERDGACFATDAGLAAIGVEPQPTATTAEPDAPTQPHPAAPPRPTKAAAVLALLGREQGATLAELIAATGWLPHTTRAALTGMRKKGHAVERFRRDDITCYRIASGR